jgi:two-component system CitB family response regulator
LRPAVLGFSDAIFGKWGVPVVVVGRVVLAGMTRSNESGRTLIVESDPAMRLALRRLAETLGHEADVAASVREALLKIGCCERLLLDLNLPDGCGTAILKRIRARRMGVKVAVVKCVNDDDLYHQARRITPDAVFTKPADVPSLQAWLRSE